jgi:hypothetical protein
MLQCQAAAPMVNPAKKGNSCSKNNALEERAKEHAGSTKNTQQQP